MPFESHNHAIKSPCKAHGQVRFMPKNEFAVTVECTNKTFHGIGKKIQWIEINV